MAERITNLSAPPVVGRRYLVPTVEWLWRGDKPRAWPVFLPLHDDARFFDFKDEHYHADPRFIDTRIWRGFDAEGSAAWVSFPVGLQVHKNRGAAISAAARQIRHGLSSRITPPVDAWLREISPAQGDLFGAQHP